MIQKIVGKIKSISFEDQSLEIVFSDGGTNIISKFFHSESFFKNKDWIYPSILNRDMIRFKIDGKIVIDASPYDIEF